MFEKPFCPLRSTNTTKVKCDPECMWYVETEKFTCAIPTLLMTQGSVIELLERKNKK